MSKQQRRYLEGKLSTVADLIARARPARIVFRSEQEFLELLSLAPATRERRR